MSQISRRDFLKITRNGILYLSGLLATGGLLRFIFYEPVSEQKTDFDLGSVDQYPLGSRTSIPEIPAFLSHTESGFAALSLACTHLGCTLESNETGFVCPCHNSSFDSNGNVKHGPAVKPMRSLRIEITTDNKLIVFTD